MTPTCIAEDVAKVLLSDWEQRPNVERLTALSIAFDAVNRAIETGLIPQPARVLRLDRGEGVQ